MISSAQNLIKCGDSTSFFINQKENFYCFIKLTGNVIGTTNNKVIFYNNHMLQTLLVNKQNYLSRGNDDILVLTTYMISETQYQINIYQEPLKLEVTKVQISKDKDALIWYYDIPDKIQKQVQLGETPAVRQVSISIVVGDFIYSIGSTQFKNQSYDELKKLLSDLIKVINYNSGQLDQSKLCN